MLESIAITPLPSTLGATVTGVRLSVLDETTWAAIEDAFHSYALLVFPDQHLTDGEQLTFAQRFGALEPGLSMAPISNVSADGSLHAPDGFVMNMLRGNEGWHTDSSYMPRAAKASMLSAHVVPAAGGETEWADMRAAYDALDDATRARVDTLQSYHSIRWSQQQAGLTGGGYGYDVDAPPLRPLVKVHPVTGRRSLFIGRHAHAIPGLDSEESARLLAGLLEFACQPPRTYRHSWRPGDIAVWDNRSVLHHACGYDYNERRVMKHTRISGDESEVALVCGYGAA